MEFIKKVGESMNAGLIEAIAKIVLLLLEKYNIKNFDENLVLGIIATESGFVCNAESPYAKGLMQISRSAMLTVNFIYKYQFKDEDMLDPYKNIECGILYLDWLYRTLKARVGDSPFLDIYVIMSYNWGIGNVLRWLKNTSPDNALIDESVPSETKSHLLDAIWWYNYFRRSE